MAENLFHNVSTCSQGLLESYIVSFKRAVLASAMYLPVRLADTLPESPYSLLQASILFDSGLLVGGPAEHVNVTTLSRNSTHTLSLCRNDKLWHLRSIKKKSRNLGSFRDT